MQTCRSCGAGVRFVELPSGSTMPIDLAPRPDGRVVLESDGNSARVLSKAEADLLPPGTARFVSHFSACPNAARHRKAARKVRA